MSEVTRISEVTRFDGTPFRHFVYKQRWTSTLYTLHGNYDVFKTNSHAKRDITEWCNNTRHCSVLRIILNILFPNVCQNNYVPSEWHCASLSTKRYIATHVFIFWARVNWLNRIFKPLENYWWPFRAKRVLTTIRKKEAVVMFLRGNEDIKRQCSISIQLLQAEHLQKLNSRQFFLFPIILENMSK